MDIDAHHCDRVYYEFENDPLLFVADMHEDGHFLYRSTGSELEVGLREAEGTKLNIPLDPTPSDKDFIAAFDKIQNLLTI